MPTALVTGGAGFIGSHLVESLLADGWRVIVLDDLSTGVAANLHGVLANPALTLVLDSVTNERRLLELLDAADEVYHLAAVVGVQLVMEQPERTAHTNIGPTEAILRHLATRPRPLFLASTSEVYGKNPTMPLREDDDLVLGPPTKSRWIYACSKALDEYLALAVHRRSQVPVVIGRFFNVVGPRQVGRYGMVLPRFVEQALMGGPLVVHGDGAQVRCFGHVRDAVRAVRALMQTPAAVGQVFNIGSDQPVSIHALAETVANLVDATLAIEHIPYEQVFDAGFEDIRCRVPDLSRLRATIDFAPRYTLRDIVSEVIAWRREQLGEGSSPGWPRAES